jgi:acyl-CoA-binding protein
LKLRTDQKLKLYGLYKQASLGDCNIPKPSAFKIEARAKFEAWDANRGMKKEDAMKEYIRLLTEADPKWESNPVMANFKVN